jgi:predicted neutral ceramidase superfamily lipid hydrolase
LRKSVRPQALAGFDMTVSRSALVMLYCMVVLVILAVLGMRTRGAAPQDREPATLIAGRRPQEKQ